MFLDHLLSNCKKLEYLKIDNTKIKYIPYRIEDCINLREIHANNSYLENIPDSIGSLKNLEYLYCVGTRIKILPNSIVHCSNLKIIDVEKTYLSVMSNLGYLNTMKSIEIIYTEDTPYNKNENNIIFLDKLREGFFQIKGNYKVQYISTFEKDRHEKIKFLSKQVDFTPLYKYKCPICYELLKSPRTTIEGHTYCKQCILEWFSTENTDPNTNKMIDSKKIFPHYLFENDLNQYIDESYEQYF